MPRTVKKVYRVYKFTELCAKAKDKARDWYRQGALHYEWWEYIYDDAERIGLKITGFDLDRNRHATGHLNKEMVESIKLILADHGKDCATYKLAERYQEELQADLVLFRLHEDYSEDDDYQPSDELYKGYLKELLECYANMLQEECDYRLSDECVDEEIKANGYEFLYTGEREC